MAASIDNLSDLEELGIDLEADDSLTEIFNKAANHLQTLLPNLDDQILLDLYAYYKQGTQGSCNTSKPSWFDMKGKAKWQSWNKLGAMPQKEAMSLYIDTIKRLDPKFNTTKESWVSVSTLKNFEPSNTDFDIIDCVKEGESGQLADLLKICKKVDFDRLDGDGMGLIHWAADRGSLDILSILIGNGANVNLQDSDGQTALHYASSCGHLDCVKFLIDHGASKDVVDNDGFTALDAAEVSVKELLSAS